MVFQRILGIHIIVGVDLFITAGLIVTYTLSVTSGHVKPLWSYISYTGDYPVESCIFSAVFGLSSVALFLIVHLRYTQLSNALIQQNLPEKVSKKMYWLNLTSYLFGLVGVLGLCMAGCFQSRHFHIVHLTGVFFCTYLTFLYLILQTYFSYTFMSPVTMPALKIFRLLLVVLSFCILVVGPILFVYYLVNSSHKFYLTSAPKNLRRDLSFKIGVVLEWILFFLNFMFITSFYPDFKKIALKKDQIIFLE